MGESLPMKVEHNIAGLSGRRRNVQKLSYPDHLLHRVGVEDSRIAVTVDTLHIGILVPHAKGEGEAVETIDVVQTDQQDRHDMPELLLEHFKLAAILALHAESAGSIELAPQFGDAGHEELHKVALQSAMSKPPSIRK